MVNRQNETALHQLVDNNNDINQYDDLVVWLRRQCDLAAFEKQIYEVFGSACSKPRNPPD